MHLHLHLQVRVTSEPDLPGPQSKRDASSPGRPTVYFYQKE